MHRAHTYSVVARDPENGDFGVAVQSHWFNVGRLVPWARAGVGAVATQSLVDVTYGPRGLDLMADGSSAPEALSALLTDDSERSVRQVAMVDTAGRVAVHTGAKCISVASHLSGDGWTVQANIMRSEAVIPAMANAMATGSGRLEDRLLAVLLAAETSGGDLRGSQSAALLVVADGMLEARTDLRIEDHTDPLGEMSRLLEVAKAYEFMNSGDDALGAGDLNAAQVAYAAAAQRSDNPEILFWQGLGLAQCDDRGGALISLRSALDQNPDLGELLRRLPASGLADADLVAELSLSLGL